MDERHRDIVVIGAGIAGLTAAWHLQRQGREVLVLEAAECAGGRMQTRRESNCRIDTGAQFLSTGYRLLPALAGSLGLALETVQRPNYCLLHDGRWRALRGGSRTDAWRRGVLGLRSWLRLGALHWKHRAALAGRDLSAYGAWAEFDDEDTATWLEREVGSEVLERMIEPLLEGFYFQQGRNTSKALTMAVLGFGWRRHEALSLSGGMDVLPTAMANRLPVRYGSAVVEIAPDANGVEIHTGNDRFRAQHVVCAIPAPQAAAIWRKPPARERALLATPYSATINIGLIVDQGYRLPRAFRDAYGGLVSHAERQRVVAVSIENHKHADRADGALLVNMMLSDSAARACMSLPDNALIGTCATEIEQLLPAVLERLRGVHVTRWPCAEPCSPVGRARAVAAYREAGRSQRRILLAGDYMGAPYTEGAAESGAWAAAMIASREHGGGL